MERFGRKRARQTFRVTVAVPCLAWFGLIHWCGAASAQVTTPPIATCEKANESSTASGNTLSGTATNAVSPVLQNNLGSVRSVSFPELQTKVVKTRTFASSGDYFRTRFSISRFLLLQPMHYFVEVNPRIEQGGPSAESVCGILGHELVHILRMSDGNRLRLLGLVRLASSSYTARFERSADLEAIRRGYGPGLVTFREWVYKNIPANAVKRKKRNYFSPEEIAAILEITRTRPELFGYWSKHVPLTLEEIRKMGIVDP